MALAGGGDAMEIRAMSEDTNAVEKAVLLDVKLVAQLTGLSVRTIWRFRDAGYLPPGLKIGPTAVRWRRTDIETWIANGCRPVRHVATKRDASA